MVLLKFPRVFFCYLAFFYLFDLSDFLPKVVITFIQIYLLFLQKMDSVSGPGMEGYGNYLDLIILHMLIVSVYDKFHLVSDTKYFNFCVFH